MDLKDFNNWTVENFQFDCFENELFEKALISVENEFKNSTINGVHFEECYSAHLFQAFLPHYLNRLTILVQQIPQIGSNLQLNVLGLNLNSFQNQKERLLLLISRLKPLYEE